MFLSSSLTVSILSGGSGRRKRRQTGHPEFLSHFQAQRLYRSGEAHVVLQSHTMLFPARLVEIASVQTQRQRTRGRRGSRAAAASSWRCCRGSFWPGARQFSMSTAEITSPAGGAEVRVFPWLPL